jgi:adenylate kinase family enzyme
VQRISVVGNSGSGKSTLARRLADGLGVPCLELDSIFHQPGWTELDLATFQQRTREFTAQPAWVVDGNYRSRLGGSVWDRADTVVWLDYPRRVVMRRVIRRTLGRLVNRSELWNGNREHWRNLFRWDPEASIIRWAWTQHHAYRRGYATDLADAASRGLAVVRLCRPRQTERWLSTVLGPNGVTAARPG